MLRPPNLLRSQQFATVLFSQPHARLHHLQARALLADCVACVAMEYIGHSLITNNMPENTVSGSLGTLLKTANQSQRQAHARWMASNIETYMQHVRRHPDNVFVTQKLQFAILYLQYSLCNTAWEQDMLRSPRARKALMNICQLRSTQEVLLSQQLAARILLSPDAPDSEGARMLLQPYIVGHLHAAAQNMHTCAVRDAAQSSGATAGAAVHFQHCLGLVMEGVQNVKECLAYTWVMCRSYYLC